MHHVRSFVQPTSSDFNAIYLREGTIWFYQAFIKLHYPVVCVVVCECDASFLVVFQQRDRSSGEPSGMESDKRCTSVVSP